MQISKRLAFLPAASDGCALWRMLMPHFNYPSSGYLASEPGTEVPLDLLSSYQVVMVQRLATKANRKALELLHERKIKVIYDLDDDFWSLPKYNPAYGLFRNPKIIHGLETCASMSDYITVSTPYLAAIVKRKIGQKVPVEVVPNCIDLNLFVRARKKIERDYVIVGWAGTPTHSIDLDPAMNALAQVMRERKNLHCEFMGVGVPRQIVQLLQDKVIDESRVKLRPWMPIEQFPAWYSNLRWDIALAPLAISNQFNRCKSSVKLLESSALGIPCLASRTVE